MKHTFHIALLSLLAATGMAQEAKTPKEVEGTKVKSVIIHDTQNNPLPLPEFGKKNLLIFYVDPDHYKQNEAFVDYLTKNPVESPTLRGYGVTNLKDAPMLPNSVLRAVMRSKQKSTGAAIYTDPDHSLRDGWRLGDCNNKFIIMLVSKEGVIDFFRYGEFTEQDKKEFFRVVEKYKTEAKKQQ